MKADSVGSQEGPRPTQNQPIQTNFALAEESYLWLYSEYENSGFYS